jgi:hypothetical protein
LTSLNGWSALGMSRIGRAVAKMRDIAKRFHGP